MPPLFIVLQIFSGQGRGGAPGFLAQVERGTCERVCPGKGSSRVRAGCRGLAAGVTFPQWFLALRPQSLGSAAMWGRQQDTQLGGPACVPACREQCLALGERSGRLLHSALLAG